MKTLMKILALASIACLVASCEEDHAYPTEVPAASTFQAEFIVKDALDLPKGSLIEPPTECLRIWEGLGESPLAGAVSVKMSLLCNLSDLSFCNLIGTMQAEDGSVLFFSIAEGKMESYNGVGCDYFDYAFNNKAVINGGTGRFAGATGSFYPNALVHNGQGSDWNARFRCKGDIQIVSPRPPVSGGLIQEP